MRRSYKKYIGFIMIMVLSVLQLNVFASVDVPETIKIGLESVYKDADSIVISSDDELLIGYSVGNRFREDGQLESKSITIKRVFSKYYELDEVFDTLEEATMEAERYNGVPVYEQPGVYRVYIDEDSEDVFAVLDNGKRIAIYNDENELVLIAENDKVAIEFQGIDFDYGFPVTTVGSRGYRGAISVVNGQSKGLTAVNTVDMEDYLYGVVPAEMVPSWPLEALKAQAVAARSMAIYQYNRQIKKGYNLVDTVTSQVYKGVSIENARTSQAVDETSGFVATYNGKIAETLYFSTSGGYTESAKDVWGNDVPYLVAVPDSGETKPEAAPWTRTITLKEIQECADNKGAKIGKVEGVEIASRTSSGRVGELNILGTSGTYSLTGENVRTFFSGSSGGSLKSRMFNFSLDHNTSNEVEATVKEVTLMSSDDIINSNLKDAFVMSVNDIAELGKNSVVQSANEIIELTTATKPGMKPEVSSKQNVVYGDVTIYGQGFGHGVGMSQSGARGMAEEGYTYDEILEYYYTGIEIE
ncbi:MAG: SpoIID/LytB domain-containing protein [Cellulosilyticaceae bacterium]